MLENRKYDQEQKSMELSQKWKENRGKLPKSKFQPSLSDEDNKISEKKKYMILLYHL